MCITSRQGDMYELPDFNTAPWCWRCVIFRVCFFQQKGATLLWVGPGTTRLRACNGFTGEGEVSTNKSRMLIPCTIKIFPMQVNISGMVMLLTKKHSKRKCNTWITLRSMIPLKRPWNKNPYIDCINYILTCTSAEPNPFSKIVL